MPGLEEGRSDLGLADGLAQLFLDVDERLQGAVPPNRMASAITASGRSLAPASTIMIASRVPETMRSSSDSASSL